jgi:hypothetical protein
MEELAEAVFSVRYMRRLYNEEQMIYESTKYISGLNLAAATCMTAEVSYTVMAA